jgi:aryl-alcohol dehydrogenase-like predicted oxidoreductase
VSSVIIGARNADQLRDNLAATDVILTLEHIARLDPVTAVTPIYLYWHQRRTYVDRNPPPA